MGFSLKTHLFWATPIYGNPQINPVGAVSLSGCAVESHIVRGVVCAPGHRAWHGGAAARRYALHVDQHWSASGRVSWARISQPQQILLVNSGQSREKLEQNWDHHPICWMKKKVITINQDS